MAAGRKLNLEVLHRPGKTRLWLVNVPPSLSPTGKRKRELFSSKRAADARVRELGRVAGRESSRSDLAKVLEPYGASLWEAVNFFVTMKTQFQPALSEHGATIYVPGSASKTWEHRSVDLPDNLMEWLKIYGTDRVGRICLGDFAQKHRGNYARAGMKEWKQDIMRHTFASNHLAHSCDLDGLFQAMGHRSRPQTLWRYYHKARTRAEAADFWSICPTCREAADNVSCIR